MIKPLLWSIVMITLVSCKKEKIPNDVTQAPPALISSFSRTFFYSADNSSVMNTYTLADINSTAKIADNKSLVIDFDTSYPNGNDNATLIIPEINIKSGYIGEYLIPLNSTETKVFYQYKLTSTSSNKLLPSAASGTLKITGYDSRFKTIKGEFIFTITTISDPVSSAINNFRQTTIMAGGSFENLVIK